MKNLIKFARNKPLDYQLDLYYFRIGKAEGFLEKFREIIDPETEDVTWELEEVASLSDIYVTKFEKSRKYDAYVLNLEINEDTLEDIRRGFWQDFIWKGIPKKPIAIVIPNVSQIGSLDESEVLEVLSLIRLTDRPWKLFSNDEQLVTQLKDWLYEVCYTMMKIHHKQAYNKEQEQLRKEQAKLEQANEESS